MKPRLRLAVGTLAFAAAVLPAWPASAPRPGDPIAIEELLRSARLWQALGHPEIERTVLRKLLAVQGDEPRALFLLGELELRSGNVDEARRMLAWLRASPANPVSVRGGALRTRLQTQLADMMRVYTQDKARLEQLRLLVRGGNTAKALALARQLFPDGRAPGDLANEFAGVLASTPSGWDSTRNWLEERIAADPSSSDRLSLYTLLAQHPDTRDQALRGFADLARAHDVEPEQVADAWRGALDALPDDDEGLAQRRIFLARFPNDASVGRDVAKAEAQRREAERLANDPGVLARQEGVRLLDAGDLAGAQEQLQRSLALRPDDGETVGTLGLLRLRQSKDEEALQLFERAIALESGRPGLQSRWTDLAATARYWSGLQQARAMRDAGDLAGATRKVESVRASQPDQGEADYLLASLYAAQSRDADAEHLYRERLERDAHDLRAWRGLLSLWLQEGHVDEALDEAEQLALPLNEATATPEAPGVASSSAQVGASAADVIDGGELRDAIARTAGDASTAHPDVRLRLLERGVGLLPRDAWLRYDLAREYQALNLPSLAQQVMEEGMARAPGDADMVYAAALVVGAGDQEEAALQLLDGVPEDKRSEGMKSLAQRMRFERDLAQARTARDAGDEDEDARQRGAALTEAGADTARRLRVARADLSADDVTGARSILDGLDPADPAWTDADRRSYARAWIEAGEPERALALVNTMDARRAQDSLAGKPVEPDAAIELALLRARAHRAQHDRAALAKDWPAVRELLPLDEVAHHIEALGLMDDDVATEQSWLSDLLQRHPNDPDVLLEAARESERAGEYDRAMQYLRAAANAPTAPASGEAAIPLLADQAVRNPAQTQPGSTATSTSTAFDGSPQARAQREIAQVEARRQPHVDVGWMPFFRGATDGLSTLRGSEIPVLAVIPSGYDGYWFAQIDDVHLDAGTLPAPIASSQQFGKVLALSPAGLPDAIGEHAQGENIAAGWRGDNRRFDIGVVGLGFPVRNLVGAWRESRTWGDTDVSAEISRRIFNSSLLSYAGAVDPVTGSTWGGVVDTALNLRAGRDFTNGWSGSTSLSIGEVTGKSVESNPNIESRTVLDKDWIHRPDFRLNAGGVLSLWHYGHNQSFYTFGQGGYYSPQSYISLGVPVEATGRKGMLSYDVRVMPAHSWTNEQNVPYYPTDGGLQALAGNPIHTAGTGGGWSGSFLADVEYRLVPHLTVGAWVDIDRSAYYTPNRAMIYLRYWFEPQKDPVPFPPRPVTPISLY